VIFEAAAEAGGMLRSGIPPYRLPKEVVDRDIRNVAALGVEIRKGARVESVSSLRAQGYDAVFCAVGAAVSKRLRIEGDELRDVVGGLEFLIAAHAGGRLDVAGKHVAVIGGGNVAVDVARTARRLGAASVAMVYRRTREEMPASRDEIRDALAEGVTLRTGLAPRRVVGAEGRVTAVEFVRSVTMAGADGGRTLRESSGIKRIAADIVCVAIGQEQPTNALAAEGIALNPNGTIAVDPATLMTSVDGVFAGGDVVTGPATIVQAIGQAKRAAFFIDRRLRGEALEGVEFEPKLPVMDKDAVLARQVAHPSVRVETREIASHLRIRDFSEVQEPLTEEEALASASNCLNCGICSECRQCKNVCPADAVDFDMRAVEREVEVGSVVVSTGFNLFPGELMERYGYGQYKNVITAMQMDRLVAPTRPYNHVLRPGDGKKPANIAYVFCVGSRDRTVANPICSRVCCMYSMKQAQLLLGALPVADVTMYYIDIRAFGKGYDEFFEQTKAMGVRFVKGKIAKITEKGGGELVLRYEDIDAGGAIREAEHDLVVLSVGFTPNPEFMRLFDGDSLEADDMLFVREPEEHVSPAKTNIEGVFAAGTATGPMDIPDTILHSGAAAAQAASYIEGLKRKR
jgi:heterodisulfide reductase subunit A